MADLADVRPVERTIEIKHPATGANLGVRVTLCSVDDERLKKVRRSITDKRLKLEQRGKNFDSSDIEANRLEIQLTSILAWQWYDPADEKNGEDVATWRGEVPVFNRKNVKDILSEASWFSDQVNEALGETDAFFTNSESN